ncbi:MAG: carboxypeptidase regulatory-like domain-containing protein, partial [Planctomycetota bacterium JB042]
MRIRGVGARRRRERSPDAHWRPEAGAPPDVSATRTEEEAALARGLVDLPDDVRTAVALRYQDGLTFAQIGEALACSASHAHDRVRLGLDRLRRALTGAGLAALAADARALESTLSAVGETPVPAALAPRLLAAKGVTAVGVGVPSVVAALFLGSAIGLAALGDDEPPSLVSPAAVDPPARVASVAASDGAPAGLVREEVLPFGETEEVVVLTEEPPRAAANAFDRTAEADGPPVVVAGRVVDPAGRPLEGLEVEARSLDRSGKGRPVIGGTSVSARDGSFAISLPAPPPTGETWAFLVRYEPLVLDSASALVKPEGTREPIVLRVHDVPDEVEAPWSLELVLRDDAGRPIADAAVALHRRVRRGAHGAFLAAEAAGRTDAVGRVLLSGEVRGTKKLVLHADHLSAFAPSVDLEVRDAAGRRELVVFDPRDLAGRVTDPAGGPVADATVAAGDVSVTTDADGRFRLDDVGPALVAVAVDAGPRGTAALHSVATGRDDLVVELDPPEGTLGTIVGRAYDAESGALVRVPWYADVDVLTVDDDLPLDAVFGDLLPNHAVPISRQQMDMGDAPPPAETFRVDRVPPRRVVVRLKLPYRAPVFLGPYDLREQRRVEDVVARVPAPARIEGVVVDADGQPVPYAYIGVTGTGPRSREVVGDHDAVVRALGGRGAPLPSLPHRTAADGRFTIGALPVGLPLRLVALHATFRPATGDPLTLAPGETRDGVTLRLRVERER